MKLLLSFVLGVVFSPMAWAIPQTVQGPGALILAGRPFEQFASDRATWAPGAALPGAWSAPAADGARTFTEPAVIFGLPAAEVRASQSSDRLTQFRVVYRETGKERRTLFTRVTQGIAAFTGHPATSEGKDAKVFRHEKTQIRATPVREGEVIVEIMPVP